MKMTPRLQKALNIATKQHDGQRRKGIAYPYIVHLFSVMLVVAEYLEEEDVLVAALLHDVIEDTAGYGADDIERDFGAHVISLVKELSEDKSLAWQERKERHLHEFATASDTALIIAAADKIHNLLSFAEVWSSGSDAERQGLRAMARTSLWYFDTFRDIIDRRLPDHPIRQRLEEAYTQARPYFISNQDI